MSEVEMEDNENVEKKLVNNDNVEEQLANDKNEEEQLGNVENEEKQLGNDKEEEEQLGNEENEEVQLRNDENEEEQLGNDEKGPVVNGIIGSEVVEHQPEVNPSAQIPVVQNPDEMKPSDDKSTEGETPLENGAENQSLCTDEQQQPLKEADMVEDEPSVDVPDQQNNDRDSSEGTEVTINGNTSVDAIPEVTPSLLTRCSNSIAGDESKETPKNWLESEFIEDDETGSPEEQAAFMKELEYFYKERGLDFKPVKFYQQPLNLLKLWRAVVKLGGYDLVTGTKLWRQVGESFHPPKTCTTVSWTFRIFYEKALLEYERRKCQSGELKFSVAAFPESSSVDNEANGYQGPGSTGRARRDAAARAMQGWHAQRLSGYGEISEPMVKDKNFNIMPKREKSLKSIGSVKHKRPPELEHSMKAARTETGKQVLATIEDAGPPADWVKINVRENEDCFEVYALVPGLLREEVRVQSDPAGRLVITGQPEQLDNPWGITAFRKVVNLPERIDPLQTSAVVSLHGRLYVRVPFEQSDI